MDANQKIKLIQTQLDAATEDGEIAGDLNDWVTQNEFALRATLGADHPTYKSLTKLRFTPRVYFDGMGREPYIRARRDGIKHSTSYLKSAKREIELTETPIKATPSPSSSSPEATTTTEATVSANRIEMAIHDDIYDHIRRYLETGDHYHAIEESYKVVRQRLMELTGEERASEVFSQGAQSEKFYQELFGKEKPDNQAEADFFRGIGYLHLGVQFLRNEKAHTVAQPVDPNLALHYIALASLAYDMITQHASSQSVNEIETIISDQRKSYRTATAFYNDFENGNWLHRLTLPTAMNSLRVRKTLKDKWLNELDFTISYDHSNIDLMRLEVVASELTIDEIDGLLDRETVDKNGNRQDAGLDSFLEYIAQKFPDKVSPRVEEWIADKRI